MHAQAAEFLCMEDLSGLLCAQARVCPAGQLALVIALVRVRICFACGGVRARGRLLSSARMLADAAVAASARAEVRAAPVGVFCSLRTYLTEDRLRNCSLSFAVYGTGQHLTASRCSASRERCTPRAGQDGA